MTMCAGFHDNVAGFVDVACFHDDVACFRDDICFHDYVVCSIMMRVFTWFSPPPHRSYPLMLIEEYMNMGDLLEVLKDSRPSMELVQQLSYAWQIADGMDYLANDL